MVSVIASMASETRAVSSGDGQAGWNPGALHRLTARC
jgi:hypothetical protein